MTKLAAAFVATLLISNVSPATPPALQFNCKVSQVLDGGAFENVNDFSFKDYPFVSYISDSIEGKVLTVGAMRFTERDEDQPSVITEESEQKKSIIIVEPEDSGQIFSLEVSDTGEGKLYYADEERSPSEVAELDCKDL